MANPFTIVHAGSGGGGAASPNDADSRELQVTSFENKAFVHEHVSRLTNAAFATYLTLTFTGTIASAFMRGIVEVTMAGLTNNVGSGARVTRWYFDYSGAAPTVAKIGTDTTSGTGPSDFQLLVSGNNILLQAKSSNGTDTMLATVFTRIVVPSGGGVTSFVVS